jgi:pimeloyl-ACP methyl ester carboxylesterase
MPTTHITEAVPSGDVTISYRRFGHPGLTPIMILHGANYFDSADWIEVADRLSQDREVVAIDQRGFGRSSWSPTKDYSNDAHIGDILIVLDALAWPRVVMLGHSRGGVYATLFAARLPARTCGLVLVDYCPGGGPALGQPSVGNRPRVFPSLEALQASMSRSPAGPSGSPAHERLMSIIRSVEGGYILSQRDPDFANTQPQGGPHASPKYASSDPWQELAAVQAPVLVVRGARSDRFSSSGLVTLRNNFPRIELIEVAAGHDVAAEAPLELQAAVSRFLYDAGL